MNEPQVQENLCIRITLLPVPNKPHSKSETTFSMLRVYDMLNKESGEDGKGLNRLGVVFIRYSVRLPG